MPIHTLNKVINYFGSATQVAKILGINQQSVSDWHRGRSKVPLDVALHLDFLMRGEVDWKELVPFEIAYRLKDLRLTLKEVRTYPCELTHVLLNRITVPNYFSKNQQNQPVYIQRPPCIDEDHALIFGHKVFLNYQEKNKKTIPCWKFSIGKLVEGKYITEDLVKTFLISERAAIGIALENFLGERRGRKKVQNSALFNFDKGTKTREFVATHLGFGSHFTYQQAKELFQRGCPELIEEADQKKISISKAASLAKGSYEEQRKVETSLTP
ncbi:Cro/CI family transcriptional regulator [Rickettsiella endosymbiont of Dermanyssus gallinae]|uniref:Cro/CI family transcriptional regulator n=1 Tax=Rickettsiella endosymbiont of Dermanyssus gallinae TaxID=2856608 RepID=UPI001C533173|nr:Cro/CI family transcriptional regulator [Rickettsiella endosymbiont of Dermanyssus gallinae]